LQLGFLNGIWLVKRLKCQIFAQKPMNICLLYSFFSSHQHSMLYTPEPTHSRDKTNAKAVPRKPYALAGNRRTSEGSTRGGNEKRRKINETAIFYVKQF
jgi:hypothetical protein